jgi:Zn-dependent protease with chaperone function
MILYAEVATWFIRTSIFTFWLAGCIGGNLLAHTNGLQGFWQRCLLLIIGGSVMNIILMGFPKLYATSKPRNLILLEQYEIGLLSTLQFLLQGTKIKEVVRNVVFFTGLKQVSITPDCQTLVIENVQPQNKRDFTITIVFLVTGLIMLLVAPLLMFALFSITQKLCNLSITDDIIKYFSFYIIGCYVFPYATKSNSYQNSSVRGFSKFLKKSYGFPVYISPIVSFTNSNRNCIGLADPQGRIFISSSYSKNDTYLNYIIAHEAGHLSDRLIKILSKVLSPVLFPCTVFVLYVFGSYQVSLGFLHLGEFDKGFGLFLIFSIIVLWSILSRQAEYRADKYAAKMLGDSSVIQALQELSLSHRTVQSATFLGNPSFDDRLERIRKK